MIQSCSLMSKGHNFLVFHMKGKKLPQNSHSHMLFKKISCTIAILQKLCFYIKMSFFSPKSCNFHNCKFTDFVWETFDLMTQCHDFLFFSWEFMTKICLLQKKVEKILQQHFLISGHDIVILMLKMLKHFANYFFLMKCCDCRKKSPFDKTVKVNTLLQKLAMLC